MDDIGESVSTEANSNCLDQNTKYCFLDIDINDSRNAYKRACQFVEANNLKYGLSSSNITQLGGREMKSLKELHANDYEWSQKGSIRIRPQRHCRLVIELYFDSSPLACENFFHLCVGDRGKSKSGANIPLYYKGSKIHRYLPGFILQGGDISFGNGSGGESIWGKKFKDDSKGLKLKHDDIGIVSMGNSGKNSNTSQFFITLSNEGAPQCDKKHVVFGKIVHGLETLELIDNVHKSNLPNNEDMRGVSEEPSIPIYITECGEWIHGMPIDGFYNHDDSFISR